MFTYNHIREACISAGIDPDKRGEELGGNILWPPHLKGNQSSTPPYTRVSEVKFPDIPGFPETEKEQVEGIGNIISNLVSQEKYFKQFSFPEDEEIYQLDKSIGKMLKTANEAQEFWFEKGIEQCTLKKDQRFKLYYGKVGEIDPEWERRQQKFNQHMKVFSRKSKLKQARSAREAAKIILD